MIEKILEQIVSKSFDYCSKEENMQRVEEKFLNPIIQHISKRFMWLTYSFQTIGILVIVQTILIVYLVFLVRTLSTTATARL